MRFKITIPEKCSAGQVLKVLISDGTQVNVRIPSGLAQGEILVFDFPKDNMADDKASKDEQANHATAATVTNASNASKNEIEPVIIDGRPYKPSLPEGSPFWFEEMDFQDMTVALMHGFVVGVFVALGFVLGILHVTEDIYKIYPIEKAKSNIMLNSMKIQSFKASIQYQQHQEMLQKYGLKPQVDLVLDHMDIDGHGTSRFRKHPGLSKEAWIDDDDNYVIDEEDFDYKDDDETNTGVEVLNDALDLLLDQ